MTEHLQECWAKDPSDPPAWCICDELRACEARVLNAAREAVRGVNWFNDEGKMLSAIVATAESLAAIDALKESK